MTKAEWKKQATDLMKAYLQKSIGYPKCDPKLVLTQLVPMWNLLSERGLIPVGATFEMFEREAHHKYMDFEMRRIIGL